MDKVWRWNARVGAVLAFASTAVLALFPGTLKLIKAFVVTQGRPRVLDLPVLIASDVLWAGVFGILVALATRKFGRSRAGTIAIRALSTLLLVVLLGLTAIEHQTWVKTALLLDWGILSYTIRHYSELQIVIASEASTAGAIFFVGAGVLVLLPLLLDFFLGHHWPRLPQSKRSRGLLLGTLGLSFVLSWITPTQPELVPLSKSASVGLVTDALSGAERSLAASNKYKASPDVSKARIDAQVKASGLSLDAQKPGPKNVLLFILESTRFDATTLYSPDLPTTQRLARMAETGAVVDRVYVDMPHTSKAITSVICGYTPRWSVEINEAEIGGLPGACAPHVFDALGYQTAFFQSAVGTFENRRQFVENAGYQTYSPREALKESKFSEVNYLALEDKAMVEPILSFVDASVKSGKHFFGTVMTCGSHHMYGLPNNFRMERYSRYQSREAIPPKPWDDYNRYLNTVRYVDEFIGDVVKGLQARKMLDDTLIVVVGDHGQGFLEHGEKFHNDVIHEEGLHVPLLFSNPVAFPKAQRIDGLRRQVDILPTILSIVGVKYPQDLFEGKDVFSTPGYARVFSNCWYDERCAAQFDGTLKVIDYFRNRPGEIYDLASDPYEKNNLLATSRGGEKQRYERMAELAHANILARKTQIEARYQSIGQADQSYLLSKEPTPNGRVPARFENYLELIGYDTPSHDVTPGGTWEAVVYFRCLQPSAEGWRLFGRFETVDNRQTQIDYNPANGRFDLKDCKPGLIIADRIRMWVPEDYPPGQLDFYWGSVLLPEKGFIRKGNDRMDSRDVIALERGVVVNDKGVRLARLNVLPKYRDDLATLLRTSIFKTKPEVKDPIGVQFGGGLVLEEARVEPAVVRPFGAVKITTLWRVDSAVRGPWQVFTHLDSARREDSRFHAPVDGLHPVTSWEPGTWVRDTYTVGMPSWLTSGSADVWIGFGYERKHMPITDSANAETDTRKRVRIGRVRVAP